MKLIPRLLLALLLAAAAPLFLDGCGKSAPAAAKQKFQCPMHPTYVSDRPGDCPICNMKLVLVKDSGSKPPAPAPAATSQEPVPGANAKPGQFYCPMDAQVISNAPGLCPECNMKLVEKKDGPAAATAPAATAPPPGRVPVYVSSDKQQLIGMRTTLVQTQELVRTVRATGVIEHDESGYARIAPRFGGWVSKLHVSRTGQEVRKGEPLFTVYSPDLLAAGNEYLLAWRAFKDASDAPGPRLESARRVLESTRRRLRLWQVGEEDLRQLETSGQARDELVFDAPVSGHVISKTAVEGRAFMAGETLYELGQLTQLWVRATVYEYELPLVVEGRKARVTLPNQPDIAYDTTVDFIYPHIDPATRRAEIRLVLSNHVHELHPDMWVNVEIEASRQRVLTVPASAVIDTGERLIAFVKGADEHLHPREVKAGTRTPDLWEVRGGLKDGEQVVSRALFLIDSESQLKAAIATMADGDPAAAH